VAASGLSISGRAEARGRRPIDAVADPVRRVFPRRGGCRRAP